jgi:hypothetical protein
VSADLTSERERLSDRIAELDALLMFRLRYASDESRSAQVYLRARRMLAERRRNNALDALMTLDLAREDRCER